MADQTAHRKGRVRALFMTGLELPSANDCDRVSLGARIWERFSGSRPANVGRICRSGHSLGDVIRIGSRSVEVASTGRFHGLLLQSTVRTGNKLDFRMPRLPPDVNRIPTRGPRSGTFWRCAAQEDSTATTGQSAGSRTRHGRGRIRPDRGDVGQTFLIRTVRVSQFCGHDSSGW